MVMVFHGCSRTVYDWLHKQPHVKEESLTDWLLYAISENCSNVYYQAFSRHEESKNGCDWEWWILTSDYRGGSLYNAYRFVVQAKKLQPDNQDNYPSLAYSNKNGIQIELLMNTAKYKNAFPLYLYYSTASGDIKEQMRNFSWIDESVIKLCTSCVNGCYLTFASVVYKLLFHIPRHELVASDLINQALKFSLLDYLFQKDVDVEKVMTKFNNRILREESFWSNHQDIGVYGIKHYGRGIPEYLNMFVERKGKDTEWLQSQMRLDDMGGIGVIDLRNPELN